MEKINNLLAKEIEIFDLRLESIDFKLNINLTVVADENNIYNFTFFNVSDFSLDDWSYPLKFDGLQVFNNKSLGWMKEKSYKLFDFEDSKIQFYFENFTIKSYGDSSL